MPSFVGSEGLSRFLATLTRMRDVLISDPESGEVLTYNGTKWVNNTVPGGGSSTLDGLTDVVIDTPADNELLAYDSASETFKNQTPAEAGLDDRYVKSDTTGLAGAIRALNMVIISQEDYDALDEPRDPQTLFIVPPEA
ncbi:MAG: hypothetical protein ACXWYM_00325 [Candidatus Binatia bacterium]